MFKNISLRNIAFRNIMLRNITAPLAVMLLFCAAPAGARDDDSLAEKYGKGVHAYFSGDYAAAYRALTRAIDAGSEDPRCHYFRGLTLLKLDQSEKAEADLAKGAELETLDRDGYYPVSRSLERVQGRHRLLVEQHRRQARRAAGEREKTYHRKRYEEIRRREEEVLRKPLMVPLENLAQPIEESPAVARPADQVAPLSPPKLPESTKPDPFALPEKSSPAASALLGDVPAPTQKVKTKTLGKVLTRILRRSILGGSGASGQTADQAGDDAGDLFEDAGDDDSDEGNPFEDDEADGDGLFEN